MSASAKSRSAVAPHAGAWIETLSLALTVQLLQVAPHAGAWIETIKNSAINFENLKWIENASKHSKSLNAKSITEKQKALTKELMATGYINDFKDECKELKLALPVDISIHGVSGTTHRKIEIGGAADSSPDPSKVLSEGEQTAVALADFLTEINLDERPLGIIFDDPVTSFDHIRKELIAKRLVKETKRRQVIIFTHDILFTNHLAKAAETERVSFAGKTVSWGYEDKVPGYVDHSVFPHSYYEGKSAKDAKRFLSDAKSLSGKEQEEKLKLGCGSLRTAYEDFIQKQVFNDVINRWREKLKPFALEKMYYDEDLVIQIAKQMGQLSGFIEAHSHTPEYSEVPLTPDLLQEHIDEYDRITKEYKKKTAEYRKKKSKESKIYE